MLKYCSTWFRDVPTCNYLVMLSKNQKSGWPPKKIYGQRLFFYVHIFCNPHLIPEPTSYSNNFFHKLCLSIALLGSGMYQHVTTLLCYQKTKNRDGHQKNRSWSLAFFLQRILKKKKKTGKLGSCFEKKKKKQESTDENATSLEQQVESLVQERNKLS